MPRNLQKNVQKNVGDVELKNYGFRCNAQWKETKPKKNLGYRKTDRQTTIAE